MITAQVFYTYKITTTTGHPVKIPATPPGSTFISDYIEGAQFRIFSVDTGCYVATGRTLEEAKDNAEYNFRIRAQKPDFMKWWDTSIQLFHAYLLYTWYLFAAKELCPGQHHSQHAIPDFFVKNEME